MSGLDGPAAGPGVLADRACLVALAAMVLSCDQGVWEHQMDYPSGGGVSYITATGVARRTGLAVADAEGRCGGCRRLAWRSASRMGWRGGPTLAGWRLWRAEIRAGPAGLDHWESLLDRGDVAGIHRTLTGLDRDSIEMREVSPVGGLLPNEERLEVLRAAG